MTQGYEYFGWYWIIDILYLMNGVQTLPIGLSMQCIYDITFNLVNNVNVCLPIV